MTNEELGLAYKAFTAYNHKAKQNRLTHFDLTRWTKVVAAVREQGPIRLRTEHKRSAWTPERTARFKATMAKKRRYRELANLNNRANGASNERS